MKMFERLYEKENYRMQKSVRIEESLYRRLKDLGDKKYDASISEIINISIEEMLEQKSIKSYKRTELNEMCYRIIQIRKNKEKNKYISNKINKYSNKRIFGEIWKIIIKTKMAKIKTKVTCN